MDVISYSKAKKAQQKADSVQAQLNQAIQNGDQLAETQQARVDDEGVSHATLKQRLDSDANKRKGLTERVSDVEEELSLQDKQTQILKHGLNVINGEVGSPLDVEMYGNTLVPLGNSVLQEGKRYVLADRKYKVKFADGLTYTGVGKFIGQSERPSIIRVANFEGKVTGSEVENPHIAKWNWTSELSLPSAGTVLGSTSTANIQALDGKLTVGSETKVSGQMAQNLFSFNIIEEIERKVGKIPKDALAEKVQWCKDNVGRLVCNWWGYGSSAGGNKATVSWWRVTSTPSWVLPRYHSNNSVTKIEVPISSAIMDIVDSNGFIHFLAYAEPSDGTTPSVINTDYVELEIELKPNADIHHPKVPLYEVTQDEYNKILTEWDAIEVVNRFPSVEGVQHVVNPVVSVSGGNLLPPLEQLSFRVTDAGGNNSTGVNITTIDDEGIKKLKFDNTSQFTRFVIITNYSVNSDIPHTISSKGGYRQFEIAGSQIRLNLQPSSSSTLWDIQLEFGNKATPYTPKNDSHLYAETTLAGIGNNRDTLFKQDGVWYKQKVWETDVLLDGTWDWGLNNNLTGYKNFHWGDATRLQQNQTNLVVTKHNNIVLTHVSDFINLTSNDMSYVTSGRLLLISVSNDDSGFTDAMSPTLELRKAYFNGWKYTGNGTTHSWVSIVDGSAPVTSTPAYVSTNKAPNYKPYKLTYQLATPIIEPVTMEGDLSIQGMAQVEVGEGVIVREKANPFRRSADNTWAINSNYNDSSNSSFVRNKVGKFIAVYKNGVVDTKWEVRTTAPQYYFGNQSLQINNTDFDPTAEYTVTYEVLDKHAITSNLTDVKATYNKSLKSAFNDVVAKQSDMATEISINARSILDIYIKLRASEGI